MKSPTSPTDCWCGCGERPGRGSRFRPGHDRFAESAVIRLVYGSVPQFIAQHGYGPGGRNLRQELERRITRQEDHFTTPEVS
jgi:hypothetical protein